MPELPEVETVARSIARIVGRRIVSAEFTCLRILRGNPDEMSAALAGRRIRGIERRGKFIVIQLDAGWSFIVHLGMTGKLLLGGTPGKHTHAVINLDRGVLRYEDQRQFGKLEVGRGLPARLEKLGPEPLEISPAEFAARLKRRKARIKAVLLDQHFLRGLGNIYADETLFRAGVHPLAIGARLRPDRVKRLHAAIVEVLTQAIAKGGSSISDYVDAEGRSGFFQFEHRVYQRTGEPCVTCGTPVRRIWVAQRGTHYCPKCQRR
ncbi:MAG TPA: bifunctional DNA-formamidopyrimidine glycosylase/DNA-(apurinic or apyrimidinic site) lyase [Bryobacteraceae bacterium]|nr:bifunctional DNA-formamidopyrimidine glycosylase/DNA-(apurinic or apyrimidinic site) lyase [Bryobacteraceae bacterium]